MDNIVEVDIVEVITTIDIGSLLAIFLLNTDRVHKAIEVSNECLIILNDNTQGKEDQFTKLCYCLIYSVIFCAYSLISDYTNAAIYVRKLIVLYQKFGDTVNEGKLSITLAHICEIQNNFQEAKQLYVKAVNIMKQSGDRQREADVCERFGVMLYKLSEYAKAKENIERALVIRIEIGDRAGEANDCGYLGPVYNSLGEYGKAKIYLEKALAIRIEIGDREGEASAYGNLGIVFNTFNDYVKAKEYYGKAIAITNEIGDRKQEALSYEKLGTVSLPLGEYGKANEYFQKALAIRIEIGDRGGEATNYANLGTMLTFLGEYGKAKGYFEKALAIEIEIGERQGEASSYRNLGAVFRSLGEYDKAKEYFEKALAIRIEIGDRGGEAPDYANLGTVFRSLGGYDRAKEYLVKALAIRNEIGDRRGQAEDYTSLANVFSSLGEYGKAKEYVEKAIANSVEIGDRNRQATQYAKLADVYRSLREYEVADVYHEKALLISKDTGDRRIEFESLLDYAISKLSQGNFEESLLYLLQCIKKFELMRNFLGVNDHFKTSFLEKCGVFPYKVLSEILSFSGNPREALYVEELGRARGLSDLMADQYSIKTEISANPQSWFGIENILRKENNCACLYISYYRNDVGLWILKTSGAIHLKKVAVNEKIGQAGLNLNLSEFFANSFRSFGLLPEEDCEDRSLHVSEPQRNSSEQEGSASLRLVEEDDEEIIEENVSLSLCYKIFIDPVADLLEEPEVIIVPQRSLYKVPFAALSEKEGKYLSETRRIRIVPSLTTLKLIQDSPADYHSQTGGLIVGDPTVGWVKYKGDRVKWRPLPCARKEAEMVGRLVGVTPFLGEQATKQAVLEKITSVSLVHFAAHGDAERGEIALSPVRTPGTPDVTPQEDDYLLTMCDISQVQLRAKLVVLSCCHSGSGQIKAEGMIGIARAFLGSGARSVLVALWAIEDTATEHLMRRFYGHLVGGESASESLHQAMKWMRNNGFTKVSQWAPFMLIGDNVTFEFGR